MKRTSNRAQRQRMEWIRGYNVDAAFHIAKARVKYEKKRKYKLMKQLEEGYERWLKKHDKVQRDTN